MNQLINAKQQKQYNELLAKAQKDLKLSEVSPSQFSMWLVNKVAPLKEKLENEIEQRRTTERQLMDCIRFICSRKTD
jgi:hypothetical protein